MTLYHVNPKLRKSGVCHASTRECPFGEANHFTSREAAEKAAAEGTTVPQRVSRKDSFEALNREKENPALTEEVKATLKAQVAWNRNEMQAAKLLVDSLKANESGTDFSEREVLMRKISALHFAKEMLTNTELTILENLEKLQREWLNQRNAEREAQKRKNP